MEIVSLIEAIPTPICILNDDCEIVHGNSAYHLTFSQLFSNQDRGTKWHDTFWRRPEFEECVQSCLETGKTRYNHIIQDSDSNQTNLEIHFQLVNGFHPERHLILASVKHLNSISAPFQDGMDTRKLQTLGRMFSGFAHDVNNLFTVVIGYTDLLMMESSGAQRETLARVKEAGKRGCALLDHLLRFCRNKSASVEVIMLNDLVTTSMGFISQQLGSHITYRLNLNREISPISAVASQIETVLLNLVLNARDAMPDGGEIVVETDRASAAEISNLELNETVDYVVLRVHDNGEGMNSEIQQKIFTPFFSTKPQNKGSGIGLSIVQGVVKDIKGAIVVDSQPERGTTFQIYMPTTLVSSALTADETDREGDEGGTDTILLVEPQSEVREFVKVALEKQGYSVIAGKSGESVMKQMHALSEKPDLLITEYHLSKMTGVELANRMQAIVPAIRFLFLTGVCDGTIESEAKGLHYSLLAKPFVSKELISKVRSTLFNNVASPR